MFTKSIEQCLPAHFKQTPRQIVGAGITVVGEKVEGVYLLQNMELLERDRVIKECVGLALKLGTRSSLTPLARLPRPVHVQPCLPAV